MVLAGRVVWLACALLALALPAAAGAASISVDTTDDELGDGTDCSLREAVEAANTNAIVDSCPAGDAGLDAITLPAGPVVLSLGAVNENANQGGDLDIEESVAIAGQGGGSSCADSGSSCIDGNDFDRAIDVRDGADPVTVTLQALTIEDGKVTGADGGAIRSGQADAFVDLNGVTIVSSEATNGGAIRSVGAVRVANSFLGGNLAAGGGALSQGGSTLQILGSVISGNSANGAAGGGGVSVDGGANAVLAGVELRGNGAAIGDGGGLLNTGGDLTIADSTFESNSSRGGGGLASRSGATISGSAFYGNVAGGACLMTEGFGGAIEHSPAGASPLTITNSTISVNFAGCAGGGASVVDTAAGTSLTHVTLTGNSAVGGGGINNDAGPSGSSPISLRASIIAANAGGDCGGSGTRGTGGFNIETGATCGLSGAVLDRVNTDPGLGPPRFNGGPTRTQLPFTTSPALNAITSGCPGPTVDQRGVGRPVGGHCDIGSVEVSPAPLCAGVTVTVAGTAGPDVLTGGSGRDVIAALGGNDRIVGLDGNDKLCGGSGIDTLTGGKGNDLLRGDGGNDVLLGGPGKDFLEGGPGKDKLRGGPGKNKLRQ